MANALVARPTGEYVVRLATTSEALNSVPRLHGRQLVVAQAVTLVAIGLAVLIYIAGLASMYTLFLGAF
jgi:hypothetical protein